MSVHVPRLEYATALTDWHRTRLALAGRSAILSDVNAFLPMPESHKQRENRNMHRLYTERAFWYGGASRTLDAWTGTLTRKPLSVKVPKFYEWRLTNIDGQGNDINALARKVVREVCAYGRFGLLVDVASSSSAANPKAAAYIAPYSTFSIISWRTRSTIEGVILDQVILEEAQEMPHESGFGIIKRTMYRVLELDPDGWYRSRLFVMDEGEAAEIETIYPTRGGDYGKLDFIPFVFVTPTGTGFTVEKAPLQDVIDANISHYQTSADYEFSLYWSASPTAVITGLTTDEHGDDPVFQVGGGTVWKLPQGAKAEYLEFRGQGLSALQAALQEKQQLMASLGASLLNAPKREAETFETLHLKASGESASLVTIADAVSKALTTCLKMATHWGYLDGPVSVELSRDLVNVRLSAEDHKILMLAVQSGLLSEDDYYWNLQQGEILRPDITIEEAKEAAKMQAPILMSSYRPSPTKREVEPEKVKDTDETKNQTQNPSANRRRR